VLLWGSILYYTRAPLVSNANDWNTITIPDFSGKYYIEDYKLIRNDEFKIINPWFSSSPTTLCPWGSCKLSQFFVFTQIIYLLSTMSPLKNKPYTLFAKTLFLLYQYKHCFLFVCWQLGMQRSNYIILYHKFGWFKTQYYLLKLVRCG
jgi:hypothetical protein